MKFFPSVAKRRREAQWIHYCTQIKKVFQGFHCAPCGCKPQLAYAAISAGKRDTGAALRRNRPASCLKRGTPTIDSYWATSFDLVRMYRCRNRKKCKPRCRRPCLRQWVSKSEVRDSLDQISIQIALRTQVGKCCLLTWHLFRRHFEALGTDGNLNAIEPVSEAHFDAIDQSFTYALQDPAVTISVPPRK